MIEQTSETHFALAHVHPNAVIHENVSIDPFSIIHEGVEIGKGSHIGANCVLYKGTKIGEGCRIGDGTVINPELENLEFWREKPALAISGHTRALIGDKVHIEPSVTIRGEVIIGDQSWIGSNVTVYDGARIGKKCKIFPGAVISGIPQDLKFDGERTTLEIGDNTTIRECATLNRGTNYHGKTEIGKNCLIMAYTHIAHDCIIGDNVVMANTVNLAGHVEVGDHAVLAGVTAFQQFVKIGAHAFVSGGSKVRKDVPPYIKVGRDPVQYEGVNSVGLRRRGFNAETINHIQEVYRHIFLTKKNNSQAIAHIETHLPYSEARDLIVNFIRTSDKGIVRGPA